MQFVTRPSEDQPHHLAQVGRPVAQFCTTILYEINKQRYPYITLSNHPGFTIYRIGYAPSAIGTTRNLIIWEDDSTIDKSFF